MPRKKPERDGKRTTVWIPARHLQIHKDIENFSGFIQICMEQAPDIMAWAILNKHDPKKYHPRKKIEDVVDDFNKEFPLDELTQKRQGTWPKNSPPKQELW